MANKKHYVMVSITLGAIAAASALLIGGANYLTNEKIKQHEINNINRGIDAIVGESAEIKDQKEIANEIYKYVAYYYAVGKENSDENIGVAYRTTGSNMYGKISLLVGFNLSNELVSISVISDEQTYAQTLTDNYIVPVQEGTRDYNDVNCGATYGAKLIRDMINDASEANKAEVWKD